MHATITAIANAPASGGVGGGDRVGDGEGDEGVVLKQLSQDQGRLSLVSSLCSAIVSPEQALWTQWWCLSAFGIFPSSVHSVWECGEWVEGRRQRPAAPDPTAPSKIHGGAFLQWNCSDVQNFRSEPAEYLSKKGIMVACLQESSKASPYTDFPNCISLR